MAPLFEDFSFLLYLFTTLPSFLLLLFVLPSVAWILKISYPYLSNVGLIPVSSVTHARMHSVEKLYTNRRQGVLHL